MKKSLTILSIFFSAVAYSQTDTLLAYRGVLKYYTNYALPNTTLKYWTGFGTFGSFLDTARTAVSLTTTGTSGAATYTPATGVFNIPQYTSTPGGSDTYVQFNNAGAFGGDSAFRYKLTGMPVLTSTKTYAGMIFKPVVAAVADNDTTVGIDYWFKNSTGILTNVIQMPLKIRNPSGTNLFRIIDSTVIVFGKQLKGVASLGGAIQADSNGIGIHKGDASSNYWVLKTVNGEGQIIGQNTGINYLESGVSQFKVTSAGAATIKTSLSSPILTASANSGTVLNAYGTSGGGSANMPNTLFIGDQGRIISSSSLGLVFGAFSGTYQNRWWLHPASGSFQNTGTEVPSAIFDSESTTKGALLPRMTKAQRDAISSPADGLLVFVTDGTGYLSWYHSGWFKVTSASDP